MFNIKFDHRKDLNIKRIRYVLNFIEEHPLSRNLIKFSMEDCNSFIRLNYGVAGETGFFMPADHYLFAHDVPEPVLLVACTYEFENKIVFGIGTKKAAEKRTFCIDGNFGFDLLETLFFHISRIEEIWDEDREENGFGTSLEQNMFLIREKLNEIPVVDELVFAFLKALGFEVKNIPASYFLTHDIDKIFKYNNLIDGIKTFLWPIIYRQSLIEAMNNFIAFLSVKMGKAKDPYDTYSFLLRGEQVWKEKIIFFMAGGKTRYDLFDADYKKSLTHIIDISRKLNYTLGIHPSYNAGSDSEMLEDEFNFLSQNTGGKISTSRQHWLRFLHKTTPEILEKLNITTDHSLGYRKHIGFRCGTGFAYALYNFREERPYNFKCQPLIVMDSSLIHFCKGDIDLFNKKLRSLVYSNRYNTCISFNFHNSTFDYTFSNRKKLKDVYLRMIRYIESLR